MAYTHSIDIQTSQVNVEGEINFDGGVPPKMKITMGDEMDVSHRIVLDRLIDEMIRFNNTCGNIVKIEVNLL